MTIDYLEFVRSDSERIAACARSGGLGTAVPTCPGWDLAALLGHLGGVYRWAASVAASGERVDPRSVPAPPAGDEVAFFEAGAAALLDTLRATDPAAAGWNWSAGPQVRGFWHRRMAHETAVHRIDAEAAIGAPSPVDPVLAADGIDEFLGVVLPMGRARGVELELPGSLHLHCTDTEGEWTLHPDRGGVRVDLGHAKGDAAVRGPAEALLAVLWRRITPDDPRLERFGDPAVLPALVDRLAF